MLHKLLSTLCLLVAPTLFAGDFGMADQGYLSRANSMDWDDDFDYGDAQDMLACDDADTDGAVIVAEDIDGDSELEQQIYVIPATGTDDSDCGGPNAADACASVQYVLDNRMNTDADPDTEDIICLVGTSNETITIGDIDGVAGFKTRTAAGLEVYDFQYPTNPNVIMGADRDQDNSYPPHDTDDTAVFEGGTPTDYLAWLKINVDGGTGDTDRWEFSHLTVKDYCTHTPITNANESCQNVSSGNLSAGSVSDHVYWHDIYLDGVNRYHPKGSNTMWLYSLWAWSLNYHALENFLATDVSGFGMRGSGGEVDTNFRVRNVTANFLGCGALGEVNECPLINSAPLCLGEDNPYDCCTGVGTGCTNTSGPKATFIKIWGVYTYVEMLNNVVDADVELWNGVSTYFSAVNTCVQNIWFRNNLVIDFNVAFQANGGILSGCTSRMSDEIYYDSNEVVLRNADYNLLGSTNRFGNDDLNYYAQDVYYINNIFRDESAEFDMRICFLVIGDSPAGGVDPSGSTITFANNTCYSDDWDETAGYFAIHIDSFTGDQQHSYVIKNNIIAGGATDDKLFKVEPVIVSFDSDYNIFEDNDIGTQNSFEWRGTTYDTLAQFASASGSDSNSKGDGQNACDVTFVSSQDLHLGSSDTCAQDESTTTGDGMSSVFTHDIDVDARPQSTYWDIGADEYESGYTPVGACCDSTCEVTTDAACTDWRGSGTTCDPSPCDPPITPAESTVDGLIIDGVKVNG